MPEAKAPKVKKVAKPAAHPPYANMIVAAIKALKDKKGSSRQAILKHVVANNKVDAVRVMLARPFTTGLLIGNRGIFRKFVPRKFPGLYGVIYLDQNYKVPVVDAQNIYQKAVFWLETLKKDGGKED